MVFFFFLVSSCFIFLYIIYHCLDVMHFCVLFQRNKVSVVSSFLQPSDVGIQWNKIVWTIKNVVY